GAREHRERAAFRAAGTHHERAQRRASRERRRRSADPPPRTEQRRVTALRRRRASASCVTRGDAAPSVPLMPDAIETLTGAGDAFAALTFPRYRELVVEPSAARLA